MQIVQIKTKKQKRQYLDFLYSIYKDDENFCDMNVLFVKNFLYQQDTYAKKCTVVPFMIYEDKMPKLEGMFIIDSTSEIKLSFVEFVPNAKVYLQKVLCMCQCMMRKYDKQKVVVGVNGQISYGLGILTADYNREFEFNANYNPDYYTKEMDKVFPIVKQAFSYQYDANNTLHLFDNARVKANYEKYQFRMFDTKHFKKDMLIFGDLCHKSLCTTPYYSEKTPEEMYELMKQVRLLMKPEDILFAMDGDKEIGFVYTHPDYAEFFNKGKLNYPKFYLRFKTERAKKIIYNVIGVLPEYQKTGIAVNLVHKSIMLRKDNYSDSVSSFILYDNKPSTNLSRGIMTGINKEYHLYEVERANV